MEHVLEEKDGHLILKQVAIPGYPEFRMFAATNASANAQSEADYRNGYYEAINLMLSAIKQGGTHERGYQHGIDALASLMKSKGRLSASDLNGWVEGIGQRWVNEVPKDVQAIPPQLT